MDKKNRIKGLILGTAVGDSIGLPAEGISKKRNNKLFKGNWRHRFLFKNGMISDDTEHTIFVAQSLIAHPNSSKLFAKRLAFCLRWWFLSLPAGIGFSTLKSIIKLWIGFKPEKSGVYSAGNGAAMRCAVIGAFFAENQKQLDDFVLSSTQITHTDPRALIGSKAISYITAWIFKDNLTADNKPAKDKFIEILLSIGTKDLEWINLVNSISSSIDKNLSVSKFADLIGQYKGVSGYIYHTVPVVLYAWYKHFGNFKDTLSSIFDCGGDTDTTGAIAGAIAGALAGENGIPKDWIDGIIEYPRSKNLLIKISEKIAENQFNPDHPVRYFWPFIIPRNILFLIVVLIHGFKRLLPPY